MTEPLLNRLREAADWLESPSIKLSNQAIRELLKDAITEILNGQTRAADEERRRWYAALAWVGDLEGLAPEVVAQRLKQEKERTQADLELANSEVAALQRGDVQNLLDRIAQLEESEAALSNTKEEAEERGRSAAIRAFGETAKALAERAGLKLGSDYPCNQVASIVDQLIAKRDELKPKLQTTRAALLELATITGHFRQTPCPCATPAPCPYRRALAGTETP